MSDNPAEGTAAYLDRVRADVINSATQRPPLPPDIATLTGGGQTINPQRRKPEAVSMVTGGPPELTDLFDVYEPIPPQCQAWPVTDENIHALAKFLRKGGDLEVNVAYDPEGATLLMKQESKPPPGGGPLLPGFAVSVRTGEMLVLYREAPDEPVVLHEGWNTVTNTYAFQKSWRRVQREPRQR